MSALSARWRPRLGVPLAFFAAAELLMLLSALGVGRAPLQAATWSHWDSGHYLEIVFRGYEIFDCATRSVGPPGVVCGDAAWFGGISWLTAGIHAVGVPAAAGMLLLARLFALATLVLVWNGLLDRRRDASSYAAMGFAAFCPGSAWYHALFPMSMATCFIVATLALVRRRQYAWAGLAAAVAATSYSTVVLFAPLLAVLLLLQAGVPVRERLRRTALVAGGTVAGALAVFVVMRLQTGVWNAFSQNQKQFAYDARFPLVEWWHRVRPLWHGATGAAGVADVQTFLVLVLVVLLVGWAARTRPRGMELWLVLYAVAFWALPLTLGQQSIYRGDGLLLPLAAVVARWPARLALTVAAAFFVIAGPLGAVYAQNQIT